MIWHVLTFIVAVIVGIGGYIAVTKILEKKNVIQSKSEADSIMQLAEKEAERLKAKAELKAKERAEELLKNAERERKEKQKELTKIENRLFSREDALDKKFESIEVKEKEVQQREKDLTENQKQIEEKQGELDNIITEAISKIETIAGMSKNEAKEELVNTIETEARQEAAKRLKQIEDDLNETAEQRAKDVIALAVQRYAGEYANEKTVSIVSLPADDMKGRIIGKEGRNIRSLESRTGVDIIIDDTPGTVVLSSLNPIRREVARLSLEALIADGRIHPARIEDVVEEMEGKIDKEILKAGEEAVFDVGVQGMHPELVKLIGKLKFRTSYSQNILSHSIEVAFICGLLASQLGVNPKLAKRAGLLHDIGKALDHEVEGSHVEIGGDIVRKYGEKPEIVESVETNHEPHPSALLSLIVHAGDAISAARPGARREMYETYVQRITEMERIAGGFRGVEKCYAIQAGREVRVIVESTQVNDEEAALLSHEIATKIEKEVAYPGKVKVTVIREVRSSAYAS